MMPIDWPADRPNDPDWPREIYERLELARDNLEEMHAIITALHWKGWTDEANDLQVHADEFARAVSSFAETYAAVIRRYTN